jgi:hypothetical protein
MSGSSEQRAGAIMSDKVKTEAEPDDDDLLTDEETSKKVNRAKQTLAGDRSKGIGIPFTKIGGRVFYRRGDIREYIDSRRFTSTAQARAARQQAGEVA